MKKIILIGIAMIILFASELSAKPGFGVSFSFFYSSLKPHGSWINIDNDVVAWRPHRTHRDWRPYSIGRWSWTNSGWYWDSEEPFGWATYHYGRWYLDDYYGWMWIPDYEWAPSWVEWRYNDDYIGWAPLPPYASFNIRLGIHFSIGWNASHNWWNFVSYNRFGRSHLHHHIMDFRRTSRFFGSTKYRNNYSYDHDRIINGGVDRSFVEKRGGYRISEREIRTLDNRNDFEKSRGRGGDRVYAYRPSENEINRSNREGKFEIQRGERNSTIERDKIITPRFAERSNGSTDQTREREIERNDSRNKQRDAGENLRNQRNAERQNAERDREAIRSREENQRQENERNEANRSRKESERKENERQEAIRPREREAERPKIERRSQSERIIERREERNTERPSLRMDGNSNRAEGRSENRGSRESGGSERRR